MKKVLLIAAFLAAATPAFAAPAASTGGTFYWSVWDNTATDHTHLKIFSQQVDANWAKVGSVQRTDTISMNPTVSYDGVGSAGTSGYVRDVEVASHNQLLVMANVDIYPPSGGYTGAPYKQPWDLLKVDTTQASHVNNYTLVNTGRLYTANTAWDSVIANRVMQAPAGWGGIASSYVSLNGSYQANHYRVFQTWPGSTTDNAPTSGRVVYDTGGGGGNGAYSFRDAEFGLDGALYTLQGAVGISNGRHIQINRTTWNGSAFATTTFLSMTGSGGALLDTECPGLAIGGTAARPIVYVSCEDNGGVGNYHAAVFALQDKDGNGVMSWNPAVDCITEVWRQGDARIGYNVLRSIDGSATSGAYFDDVEFDNDGKHSYLMFNEYGNGLAVVQLADNGVAGVSGAEIFPDVSGGNSSQLFGPMGSGVGFEFDANSVPEPMSLMLLGTGALGAVSWMRRRRIR